MARTSGGVDVWRCIREMILPELARYRQRFPRSRRRRILERMWKGALREESGPLLAAATDYFRLTSIVPPGCWASDTEQPAEFALAGQRISGRGRCQRWRMELYDYQRWR
jgi:hypothetical protein